MFVSGRGWGHGVGMSQYGALGFANEGRGFAEILAHFYPGTTLGPVPAACVRVLLQEQRPAFTISSPVPFRVRGRFRQDLATAGRRVRARAEARAARQRRPDGARRADRLPPGHAASPARLGRLGRPLSRTARRLRHRSAPERCQRRRARAVPRGGCAAGDAGGLASRGAEGAGGGGSVPTRSPTGSPARRSISMPTSAARFTEA